MPNDAARCACEIVLLIHAVPLPSAVPALLPLPLPLPSGGGAPGNWGFSSSQGQQGRINLELQRNKCLRPFGGVGQHALPTLPTLPTLRLQRTVTDPRAHP
jgi:hypothetical protein